MAAWKVKDVSSLNATTAVFRNGVVNHVVSPGLSNNFVDVRDVALAHVLALETPGAGGERIIVSNQQSYWRDLSMSTPILGLEDEQLKKNPYLFSSHNISWSTHSSRV